MRATDLEIASFSTQHIAKVLADAPQWQIIEKFWNTAMQQNNISPIACEPHTKEILNEEC
jgi:hypothetical protein